MRLRVKPLPTLAFFSIAFILNTFNGLSGFLSIILSVLLPSIFFCSIAQLVYSWWTFTFHQTFSNDHPLKGEVVRYELHTANESILPTSRGVCIFSSPGSLQNFKSLIPLSSDPKGIRSHTEEIRCAFRGTYIIGLSGYSFHEALGMFQLEEKIEPRIFYVYPELVRLNANIERITGSSGADQSSTNAQEEDRAIFEYVKPLREGTSERRIAWKHWAARGIPAEIVHGKSRSTGLRLVLDLWPHFLGGAERLAAEDMAVSAVFSVLQYLTREEIPVTLYLGGEEKGIIVDSAESFTNLFDQSTSIIFSDTRFPSAAFSPGPSTLLVSTRPLIKSGLGRATECMDIFTAYEDSLLQRTEPHMLMCPPPMQTETEKRSLETLAERQGELGGKNLLRLADARQGVEDIIRALCT